MKILPSPILPVRAAWLIASTARSTRLSGSAISSFTLGRKSTTYSAPRYNSVWPFWRPKPLTSVTVRPVTPTSDSASRTSSSLNGLTMASIFFMGVPSGKALYRSDLESVRVVDSLAAVDPQEWNALAGPQPFVRHEFLSALIDTGCASRRTGWRPQIVLVRRSGALVGALPLFEKNHSYGEYVFDWAWAEAHERHGIDYYPKLVCAVPFTPVRGRRLLAASAADREILVKSALELAQETSSLHVLFAADEDAAVLAEQGFLMRRTVQFHWANQAYTSFEDFLARLSHARRKNIRQERRRVHQAGVTFRWLEGPAIEQRHWEFFNRCYRGTYAAHRATPYLSLEFFLRLGAMLPAHVAMVLAERDGRPLACAFFLRDEHALYGRYWGAAEHVPLLHF